MWWPRGGGRLLIFILPTEKNFPIPREKAKLCKSKCSYNQIWCKWGEWNCLLLTHAWEGRLNCKNLQIQPWLRGTKRKLYRRKGTSTAWWNRYDQIQAQRFQSLRVEPSISCAFETQRWLQVWNRKEFCTSDILIIHWWCWKFESVQSWRRKNLKNWTSDYRLARENDSTIWCLFQLIIRWVQNHWNQIEI